MPATKVKRTVETLQHPLRYLEEEQRTEVLGMFVHRKPKLLVFCKVCRGIGQSCVICHSTQAIRLTYPELVAHSKYMLETWKKLRRFEMLTTGNDLIDHECHRMYGHWVRWSDDLYLLAVVSSLNKKFNVTFAAALKIVEKDHELILAARYSGLNSLLQRIAIQEELPERSHDGRADLGRKNR